MQGTINLSNALAALPGVVLREGAPLSQYTRFGIGGPAALLADVSEEHSFMQALQAARQSGMRFVVLGAGSNLVVSDEGFDGLVLRLTTNQIRYEGERIVVECGAVLQELVNFSIRTGLAGLHTMTGIPGWVGAAIYGNAGAYGHSIHEFVRKVRFSDGDRVREFDNAGCQFAYRESIFKKHKEWILLSAELELPAGDCPRLQQQADAILATRNAKYPPTMKCAGSIFKNLILAGLPEAVKAQVPGSVIREGKVPSAWFLEQVGAKGIRRGDIQVATYHANLIYNGGAGTARDLRDLIADVKSRVHAKFGLTLEEEVQYVGF
jgi:UDP-N-acetylmuramate dehydrogenase